MYRRFDVDIATTACNVIKNETPLQAFSCEFCKVFKNNNFAKNQKKTASSDMIIARFFYKIYVY